jgi:hypothetical protein
VKEKIIIFTEALEKTIILEMLMGAAQLIKALNPRCPGSGLALPERGFTEN